MWTLFTAALARGNSTTQVSIMNTSSNFVITAILGFAIFSESLPPLWWAGASLLVAGNVIIGRKDEGEKSDGTAAAEAAVGDGDPARVSQRPETVSGDDGSDGDDGLKDEEDEEDGEEGDDDIVDLGDVSVGGTLVE